MWVIAWIKGERLNTHNKDIKLSLDYMFEIHLLGFTSSISIDFRKEEYLCYGDVRKIIDINITQLVD